MIQAAQTLGTMAAFETNNWFAATDVEAGAACSGTVTKPTPCTDATYLALLQTGIYPLGQNNNLRAQYIEVWPSNANTFPNAIQQAHIALVPQQPSSTKTTSSKTSMATQTQVTSPTSITSAVPSTFSPGISTVTISTVVIVIVVALTLFYVMKRKKTSA